MAEGLAPAEAQLIALAHESEGGASPTGASPSLMILNSAGMLLSLMAVRHAVTTRVLGPPARRKAAMQWANPGQRAVKSGSSVPCKQCALQSWVRLLTRCSSLACNLALPSHAARSHPRPVLGGPPAEPWTLLPTAELRPALPSPLSCPRLSHPCSAVLSTRCSPTLSLAAFWIMRLTSLRFFSSSAWLVARLSCSATRSLQVAII